MKKILSFILIALATTTAVRAQTDTFCTALHAIIADAGNKFILTKGATIDANPTAIKWDCNIPLPGVLNARVVSSMGLFYEAALGQTKSPDELQTIYDKYKRELSMCLLGDQYKLTTTDNFNKGVEAYRKLIYMQPTTDESLQSPPPHISLEVDYYKPTGVYTVILYVFEH